MLVSNSILMRKSIKCLQTFKFCINSNEKYIKKHTVIKNVKIAEGTYPML